MKSSRSSSCWRLSTLTFFFLVKNVHSFVAPPTPQRHVFLLLKASSDHDGWNDDKIASEIKMKDNLQLLKTLQEKPTTTQPSEKERDMFIPIFTLVSIAGFTGAYGYEMLQLYSRGELYLPF